MSKWEIEVLYDNGVIEKFDVEATERDMNEVASVVVTAMSEGGFAYATIPNGDGNHMLSVSKITRFSVKEVEQNG
jgi:hypothetical protein